MKKEIKSSSKRKWIVGGVVFFGALALLTTGFATWIIGVQNTSLNQDVGVSVSTTTNESVVLTANLSDSATIKLAESTEVTKGFMKAYGDAVVTDPLQITFSDLNIVYGKEYKLSENFNHLHFAFDLEDTTTEGVKVASNGSKIATTYRAANSDGWTYIEAPDDVSIPILEPPVDSGNNSYIIDFSQKTFDFKWGTFFGGKSPATFYNEKFPGENTAAQDEEQNNVQAEMTAMYNALNAKTIKVIVSLTKTA